jgi:outer membrane lipoprotein-sorting protein
MDCKKCKLEMVNLFDTNEDFALKESILEHIKQCPDCEEEYHKALEIISMLKPKLQPKAPFQLKQNIKNQLKMEDTKMKTQDSKSKKLNPRFKKFLMVAAVVALGVVIVPIINNNTNVLNGTARAANSLIDNSIRATQLVKSMIIKLQVRTLANDNFSLIGAEYNMVNHSFYKSFSNPEKWRLEKPGRVVVNDGEYQYLHMVSTQDYLKASRFHNMIEDFEMLLEPEKILIKEQYGLKKNGSTLTMEVKDGLVYLTVSDKAQGDFINDYMRNTSIGESDNRREYVFDNDTKLLRGMKIYLTEDTKETLIVNIESIEYNVRIDPSLFAIEIPKGQEWRDLDVVEESKIFTNITSKKAAEIIFNGLAKKDWQLVAQAYSFFDGKNEHANNLKEKFGGLTLVKLGEPFKSGQYAGEFVPYEVRLKSGEIKRFNLALRNDNPNKVWLVDGGL